MAKMYASKFGVDLDVMADRMWGEKYFNPKKKSFTKSAEDGNVRTFEQFVLNPIKAVAATCESGTMNFLTNWSISQLSTQLNATTYLG